MDLVPAYVRPALRLFRVREFLRMSLAARDEASP